MLMLYRPMNSRRSAHPAGRNDVRRIRPPSAPRPVERHRRHADQSASKKDILSQIGTLRCMRVLHRLDRIALKAWIEAHDTGGRQAEFMASPESLGRGMIPTWAIILPWLKSDPSVQ